MHGLLVEELPRHAFVSKRVVRELGGKRAAIIGREGLDYIGLGFIECLYESNPFCYRDAH